MRPASLALLIAVSIHLASALPLRAEVAALVVGIDAYRHEAKLEGTVNDARDIDAALRRLGAGVTLLLDADATRARIEAAWSAMAARAKPGDTLVFAFAGHGSQETEAGGARKVNAFLLADFDRRSEDRLQHRIASHEIKGWFRATPAGVRVIFVADTCHSGLMLRGVDRRAGGTVRAVAPYGLPDWAEVPADEPDDAGHLGHVTFLAATEVNRKIQAVPIDGRPRGALSYAFARVLERVAAEDGKLRRLHLESHVRPVVRQLSEGRQIPKLLPSRAAPTEVLLEGTPGPGRREPTGGATIRLGVLNLDADGIAKLLDGLDGAVPATGAERPDLVWDAQDGSLITGQGDIAAWDVEAGALQSIVDRWRLLAEVKRLAAERPLSMALEPDDGRQPSGRPVAFLAEPPRYPYLTSFNLQADGSVSLLYPLQKYADAATWPAGKRYRLDLEVVAPFGADHLVVIASSGPLDTLHRHLARTRAADLPRLLQTALAGLDWQVGVQALYTYDDALERR